jgi:DNA-directed RNA polymerase alpha subunit
MSSLILDDVLKIEHQTFDTNDSVDDMELSVRAYNCLKRAGYDKVSQFIGKTTDDLMKIRNLGRKSMEEVMNVLLNRYGIVIKVIEHDDENT